ncbi:MAG: AMP-binding protein [Oscillospiraceae bacterium]|nr:AMP-binding protein [Oscillospiraceae bacterium]
MIYENVSEYFLLSVRRNPNKTALVFGDERYSYAQANSRINRIANALLAQGIRAGDKVAFLFPNSCEIVLLYYAIQKIGAVAVPLNFRLIPREIGLLVASSDTGTLIVSPQFAGKALAAGLPESVRLICGAPDARFALDLPTLESASGDSEPEMFRDGNAISRIQFTGGSTGVPKGVMRSHFQDICELMGEMLYCKLGSSPDQVVLIQCPLEHHGGHSWFTATLCAGGTLIICPAYDPEKILDCIERERVTYMLLLPPTTYLRLCEYPGTAGRDLSSVRVAQSAAGGTTPEIIARMERVFPNAEIYYGWGQTESGLGTTLTLNSGSGAGRRGSACSVGRPMPFVEMKIVDEDWNELPDGEAGEAAVRSQACMTGYYGHPELTAELMGPDGWMRTGDIMSRDAEGYFYMLSRKKNVIKSGGENVFCADVENVVKLHPAVLECVVAGVPDERLGEAVMAVMQLRPGMSLTLEELQEHCKKYLSSYKKPLHMELVDSFGMDDAGKIRKDRLREILKGKYNKT